MKFIVYYVSSKYATTAEYCSVNYNNTHSSSSFLGMTQTMCNYRYLGCNALRKCAGAAIDIASTAVESRC